MVSLSSRWDVLSISHCSYEARTLVRTDSYALTPPAAASGNPGPMVPSLQTLFPSASQAEAQPVREKTGRGSHGQ